MEGNSDVPSASALEAQPIGETGEGRASTGTGAMMYKTEYNTFLLAVCYSLEQYG